MGQIVATLMQQLLGMRPIASWVVLGWHWLGRRLVGTGCKAITAEQLDWYVLCCLL